MSSPRNASKTDPMLLLAEAMGVGMPSMIERQEAQGQQQLINSSVLPAQGLHHNLPECVVVGKAVERDSLFINVMLPEGWKKVATEHSMWSKLVDDQGKERASIFYKAAFYDRDAFIRWNN